MLEVFICLACIWTPAFIAATLVNKIFDYFDVEYICPICENQKTFYTEKIFKLGPLTITSLYPECIQFSIHSELGK